jgi:hypothetical protein
LEIEDVEAVIRFEINNAAAKLLIEARRHDWTER